MSRKKLSDAERIDMLIALMLANGWTVPYALLPE